MRTIVTARNYGTWLFERFDLAELCAGATVLVGFDDEYGFLGLVTWAMMTRTRFRMR